MLRFSCSVYHEIRYCWTITLLPVTRSWLHHCMANTEWRCPGSNVSRGIEILIVRARLPVGLTNTIHTACETGQATQSLANVHVTADERNGLTSVRVAQCCSLLLCRGREYLSSCKRRNLDSLLSNEKHISLIIWFWHSSPLHKVTQTLVAWNAPAFILTFDTLQMNKWWWCC